MNILIAEDHKLFRKISRQILAEMYPASLIHETDAVTGIVEYIKTNKYDLIMLDVHLTDGNTLTILSTVRTLQPDAAILYFTMVREDIFGKRVLNSGANGFLSKLADENELREAVTTVVAGDRYISRKLQRQIANETISQKSNNPFDRLSDREFEVLMLLLQGRSLSDIAEEIAVGVSTVGTHKTRLFDKLDVSSLIELSRLATAYAIVP